MNHAHGELDRRLAALRSDFAELGTRAAGAAQALAATLPPPATLLDELSAAGAAFAALRSDMLDQAVALSLVLDAEALDTLRDLEPVLAAIGAAGEQRARRAAWDVARMEALGVLDRVAAIVHREDRPLPALGECQSRARELHGVLSGPPPERPEQETALLPERMRPYTELLALIDGWNVLDDDRCASLQDAITAAFGRTLALAALRGKLGREDTPPPAAPSVAPPVVAGAEVELSGALQEAPAGEASDAEILAGDGGALLENPGLGGETVVAETPERREQEEQLERLAQETARWWIAARGGWQGLRERGLTFGDAAHDYLQRYPYLLSVPIQRTGEYERGRLAEGYALLLAHIEKQEPGFVKDALSRLNPQFGTRDRDEPYPLGQELYLYIVAEGRLYKTYPDFVREVVLNAVPKPGAWVQGGIVDADDATRLFMRPETPGSTEEQARTLTDPKERLGPHLFRVTLGPLTTRFFTLQLAGDTLADPPNVEIKLRENDAPTDHAWLVTLPVAGKSPVPAPRKHRTGGTVLEELGKQFGGFWMGVFNADPSHDRHYELSVVLRRKPPPVSGKPAPAPGPDRFFGKKK